jgi:putative copper export protein
VKPMRGYRFRREALKMLSTFGVIWIVATIVVGVYIWIGRINPILALVALALGFFFLMVTAVVLLILWLGIRGSENGQSRLR